MRPSLVATTVGCDVPTAIIAPYKNKPTKQSNSRTPSLSIRSQIRLLTVPGGRIASKRSTPNIPRLERVKVPRETTEISEAGANIRRKESLN